MPSEWTDQAADAARQAAARREAGGASVPAGGSKGPGDASIPAAPAQAPDAPGSAPVMEPAPEEAPELLGERSDYPTPRADPDE